jgi:hypothetical protein
MLSEDAIVATPTQQPHQVPHETNGARISSRHVQRWCAMQGIDGKNSSQPYLTGGVEVGPDQSITQSGTGGLPTAGPAHRGEEGATLNTYGTPRALEDHEKRISFR